MRNERSWTRQTYDAAYRLMRRGQAFDWLNAQSISTEEVLKAADYSYQARDHEVHAWSNNMRRKWFHKTLWRILSRRYVPENNPPPIQIDIDRW